MISLKICQFWILCPSKLKYVRFYETPPLPPVRFRTIFRDPSPPPNIVRTIWMPPNSSTVSTIAKKSTNYLLLEMKYIKSATAYNRFTTCIGKSRLSVTSSRNVRYQVSRLRWLSDFSRTVLNNCISIFRRTFTNQCFYNHRILQQSICTCRLWNVDVNLEVT